MGSEVTHGVKGHPMGGQRSILWALWGPISSYGIYRIKRGSMGSKPILWGQRSPYGVRGHPRGQRSPYGGSKVTLWGPISPYGLYGV